MAFNYLTVDVAFTDRCSARVEAETALPRFLVLSRCGSLFSACRLLEGPYRGRFRPGMQSALETTRGDGDGYKFRLRTADVDAVGDLRSSVVAGSA
ncbi:hypothetical protein PSEUDO9AG_70106 [Pseudomonas sp. 9Ag]|nr:hypothetical protein PSEUDO9AG_70106 [Pseudomonas sp. 9Ag]